MTDSDSSDEIESWEDLQGYLEADGAMAELQRLRGKCVPVEELEALVAEWREDGIPIHQKNPNPGESAGRKAADELEQRIEQYD